MIRNSMAGAEPISIRNLISMLQSIEKRTGNVPVYFFESEHRKLVQGVKVEEVSSVIAGEVKTSIFVKIC